MMNAFLPLRGDFSLSITNKTTLKTIFCLVYLIKMVYLRKVLSITNKK